MNDKLYNKDPKQMVVAVCAFAILVRAQFQRGLTQKELRAYHALALSGEACEVRQEDVNFNLRIKHFRERFLEETGDFIYSLIASALLYGFDVEEMILKAALDASNRLSLPINPRTATFGELPPNPPSSDLIYVACHYGDTVKKNLFQAKPTGEIEEQLKNDLTECLTLLLVILGRQDVTLECVMEEYVAKMKKWGTPSEVSHIMTASGPIPVEAGQIVIDYVDGHQIRTGVS